MSHNISNASAIEVQQSMINIKSIEHVFYPTNTNLSNNLNNNFAPTLYFAPTAGQIQSMRSLVMNLYSPTEFSKTNKFKFKIYFKITFKDSAFHTMALPNCPPGSDGFRIYECNIEQLDQTTILSQLNQYPGPGTGSYLYYWSAINETDVYYVMNIKGYYNNNNLVSRNEIKTSGSFFLVKNTDSALTSDVRVDMFFTPVIVFIDELSPSDEAAEKELESTTNIENQTPQNTTGGTSENQQTTSIIGTISSFVGAFSNISPAQNCQMVLPFPDFVGGNQTVDICQGKDKAPAIITIASSLLLIVTFVPVAFIVLSMIYREIRSFTNG